MPIDSVDIASPGDGTRHFGGHHSENGALETLCVIPLLGTTTPGRTRVQAGLYRDSVTTQNLIAVLLDDFVWPGHSPTWSGKLNLEQNEGIFGFIWSLDPITCRVIGRVLSRDP